jgi:hypothetical protein
MGIFTPNPKKIKNCTMNRLPEKFDIIKFVEFEFTVK